MKYRADFVTNSSSSSFVCAFKNNSDMLKTLKHLNDDFGHDYAQVLHDDMINNRVTREEALKEVRKYLKSAKTWYLYLEKEEHWKKLCRLSNVEPTYVNCVKLQEFKDVLKKQIESEMKKVYSRFPKNGIFGIFEVCDDREFDWNLQYNILPKEPCVVYSMENHY